MRSVNILLVIFTICKSYESSSIKDCVSKNLTVCSFETGLSSCCPIKNGVCCQNSDFCCPKEFECDVKNKRCVKEDLFIPFHLRTESLSEGKKNIESEYKEILCPDNDTTCHEFQTCCIIGDQWGCCPLPNANCCNDKIHCCPKSYTCDPEHGKCNRKIGNFNIFSIKWYSKEKGLKKNNNSVGIVCPGGDSECPVKTTCCELSSGEWGCCPLPKAVCCEDKLHCCPDGYICDTKAGRCSKGDVSLPFYHKIKAISKKIKTPKKDVQMVKETVVCPGGSSECPKDTTCCQLSSGEWGCCPLPNALCCEDKLHCCPSGFKCDVKDGRCNKQGFISIPFFDKIKSVPVLNEPKQSVVCPGGASECPTDTTCCPLSTGEWGCCPLKNAVCCEDKLHCCPTGYTCDSADGRCLQGDKSVKIFKKFQSKPSKINSIVCPDGVSFCPTDNTCCLMSSGSYGCCPLPRAVCCEDEVHCCPEKSRCDEHKEECVVKLNGKLVFTPWQKKTDSISIKKLYIETKDSSAKIEMPILCQDNQTTCGPLKTCCKLSDKSYGCCDYTDGICCNDFCCPSSKKCGKKIGECLDIEPVIQKEKSTDCSICASNTTCCQRQIDQAYECCPYPQGTCCGVHGYCCPKGYTCNAQQESCELNGIQTAKNEVIAETLISSAVKSIKHPFKDIFIRDLSKDPSDCGDDTHYCDEDNTCCQNKKSGSYGCCPIQNAVCCANGINCCPSGYECSSENGSIKCKKNDENNN